MLIGDLVAPFGDKHLNAKTFEYQNAWAVFDTLAL
jgi:hypothetical protein